MSEHHPADINGDGVVTDEELKMYLSLKEKNLKIKMHNEMQLERWHGFRYLVFFFTHLEYF